MRAVRNTRCSSVLITSCFASLNISLSSAVFALHLYLDVICVVGILGFKHQRFSGSAECGNFAQKSRVPRTAPADTRFLTTECCLCEFLFVRMYFVFETVRLAPLDLNRPDEHLSSDAVASLEYISARFDPAAASLVYRGSSRTSASVVLRPRTLIQQFEGGELPARNGTAS